MTNKKTEKENIENAQSGAYAKFKDSLGVEKLESFDFADLFSETFKSRGRREVENYYLVGCEITTPKIHDVEDGWPKPWLFVRTFFFMFTAFLILVIAYFEWANINLIPGIIFIGCFAMPMTVVTFFFEMNSPHNISIPALGRGVIMGGVFSLFCALIFFDYTSSLNWMGDPVAGIAEEPAKLVAVLLISRGQHYPYILNGILLGAAVGAGFAAFESMGYALQVLVEGAENYNFLANISLRGVLSPFAHIAWTAMIAGAYWRVSAGGPFSLSHITDPRFLKILIYAVALHMIWNLPIQLPFFGTYIILGVASWMVILGLLQEGYKEIRIIKAQSADTIPTLTPPCR